MSTVVLIDGDPFTVTDPSVVDVFRADVRAAVRTSGDLVLLRHDRGTVELLISPATSLRIVVASDGDQHYEAPEVVFYDPNDL